MGPRRHSAPNRPRRTLPNVPPRRASLSGGVRFAQQENVGQTGVAQDRTCNASVQSYTEPELSRLRISGLTQSLIRHGCPVHGCTGSLERICEFRNTQLCTWWPTKADYESNVVTPRVVSPSIRTKGSAYAKQDQERYMDRGLPHTDPQECRRAVRHSYPVEGAGTLYYETPRR
ncbi:hypothetical protein B0H21DRAFT_549368 [Amylocystis lapponica]|nr:hypothetical protein B0H21DRAFT_549368 [Amylocystis lapponica]